MSYLRPYLDGKRKPPIPADFREVFEFIALPEVNVDPLPYISESYRLIDDARAAEKIFSTFVAYEVLRTLDADWLRRHGEVRSTATQEELRKVSQQRMSEIFLRSGDEGTYALNFRHRFIYAFLLNMVVVQLRSPSMPLEKKIVRFLDFCDREMCAVALRLTAIAAAYFSLGSKLRFFRKIGKNQDDNVKQLKNMAWDIWHLSQLEESMTYRLIEESRYFFPAILTFDKGFIEIIDLYPLKSLAFKVGTSRPIPVFEGDPDEILRLRGGKGTSILAQYFLPERVSRRAAGRDAAKRQLPDIVASLERELTALK